MVSSTHLALLALAFVLQVGLVSTNETPQADLLSYHIKTRVENQFARSSVTAVYRNFDPTVASPVLFRMSLSTEAIITGISYTDEANITHTSQVNIVTGSPPNILKAAELLATRIDQPKRKVAGADVLLLSFTIPPDSEVKVHTQWDEVLPLENDRARFAIHLNPGQVVPDVQVDMSFYDSRGFLEAQVDGFDTEPHVASLTFSDDLTRVDTYYAPTVEQQSQAPHGSAGIGLDTIFAVSFVPGAHELTTGTVNARGTYFTYRYSPPANLPLFRHSIVFVLDEGNTMTPLQQSQMHRAVLGIMADMTDGDQVGIIIAGTRARNANITTGSTLLGGGMIDVTDTSRLTVEELLAARPLEIERRQTWTDTSLAVERALALLGTVIPSSGRLTTVFYIGSGETTAPLGLNNVAVQRQRIVSMNAQLRARVIALGTGVPNAPLLSAWARDSGGRYLMTPGRTVIARTAVALWSTYIKSVVFQDFHVKLSSISDTLVTGVTSFATSHRVLSSGQGLIAAANIVRSPSGPAFFTVTVVSAEVTAVTANGERFRSVGTYDMQIPQPAPLITIPLEQVATSLWALHYRTIIGDSVMTRSNIQQYAALTQLAIAPSIATTITFPAQAPGQSGVAVVDVIPDANLIDWRSDADLVAAASGASRTSSPAVVYSAILAVVCALIGAWG